MASNLQRPLAAWICAPGCRGTDNSGCCRLAVCEPLAVHWPSHRLRPRISLQAISGRQPPVRVPRPLVRRARTVSSHDLTRPPAAQPHEVLLLAALVQPRMGEGVPEEVRMHVGDAGL